MSYKQIYRTAVTGLSHHDYALVATDVEVGVNLDLEADPGNKYDEYATKVMYEGAQIGWIPKGNEIINKLVRQGFALKVVVISHDTKKDLSTRLYIGIYAAQSE